MAGEDFAQYYADEGNKVHPRSGRHARAVSYGACNRYGPPEP